MAAVEDKPWRAEVIADSSGKWAGNGLRFTTAEEAEVYVIGLYQRWTLVTQYRVIKDDGTVALTGP